MREEILKKQIKLAEEDNFKNEVLIGYLLSLKTDMTKEEKAQVDLKVEKLRRDIKFNEGYVKFASKL